VLADIGGQPMILHVWRQVVEARCVDRVLIATDDDEIAAIASRAGAEVARTGPAPSGTHRVAQVVGQRAVSVLNVQGDQPFVERETLQAVCALLDRGAPVATARALLRGDPAAPARVKVTVDEQGRALRFSRRPLSAEGPHYVHIGIYGFGAGWLPRCASSVVPPELAGEELEQLAWLAAGIEIRVADVERAPLSVDTPEDLQEARRVASDNRQGTRHVG
jgi:3-deoxy-manno-octulosonate cytidylyltransferase (CMP-KDO synthetase)